MKQREMWVLARRDQILSSPYELAKAFGKYIQIKPTAVGQALRGAASGTVGDMLALDDMIVKAAECQADDEWCEWRTAA